MENTELWLTKISRLRVDHARGNPAPHKPLLLLVVFELAEQGTLPEGPLQLSPELAFRFFAFWNIVAHRRTTPPDVRLPFHHLQNDGFWSALDKDGKPSPGKNFTQFAALNPDFVVFAKDRAARDKARRLLITRYFQPMERIALYTLVGLSVPQREEEDLAPTDELPAKNQGREGRFRLTVVAAYDYTCALTGYRLTTVTAGSIVEAAHIHQFADSRNNDPRNGVALSKNAHWLFDQGLWTLTDDYRVLVAVGQFAEHSPNQKPLSDYNGKKVRLPGDRALWPKQVHLAWHRKNKFQGTK